MAEGTALAALPSMKRALEKWPKEFPSVESCIDWSVRHHHPTKIISAEKSIPSLLRRTSPDGPFVMRPRLADYEENWESWFLNFNSSFLKLHDIKIPHLLLLSSLCRLDKELTVAQMQGKFQLRVIQGGLGEHFLHVSTHTTLCVPLRFEWNYTDKSCRLCFKTFQEDQWEQTLAIFTNFLKNSGLISQKLMGTIMTHTVYTSMPTQDYNRSQV